MAGHLTDQAHQKTAQMAEQIKQQASSRLSSQVDRAAEGLGNLSQARASPVRDIGGRYRRRLRCWPGRTRPPAWPRRLSGSSRLAGDR